MIYVSKRQLGQVEYLISQSIQGNHVLFDPKTIKEILVGNRLSGNQSYEVEHHIERLILQPTLEQKRAYLERLDPDTYERVVKTYFNIVENNLYENNGVRH